MVVVMERKETKEIITLSVHSVVFDGNRIFLLKDKLGTDFEVVTRKYWQIVQVCDE